MENIKKYFNVLRNNEDISYGGLKTLKLIENKFDEFNNHKIIHLITAHIIDVWLAKKISDDEYNEIRKYLWNLEK